MSRGRRGQGLGGGRLGRRSGFDIEGASGPVVVPIPQTGIARTLNLSEEPFPDRTLTQIYERERETQIAGERTRGESKSEQEVK